MPYSENRDSRLQIGSTRRILFCAALLLTLAAVPARAQTITVRGSVQDATGAMLTGATVRGYQGDQLAGEAVTASDGRFALPLPPGEYRIEISAPSFSAISKTVTVAARMAPVDFKLQLAPVQQTLDVQDQAYQISLEPDRNLTGLVLDEKAVQELPEDTDELAQLLRDLAGPGADAVGGAEITTDGFTGGQLPPRDQIREIRINNNPFSAESSRQGRGRIEIITRAGGDALRGNIGFEARSSSLNARNAFASTKPAYSRRDLRSNLSGTLIQKKMSFSLGARRSNWKDSDSLKATTLLGELSAAVLRPNMTQEYNSRIQYNLPHNHFLNFNVEYGSNSRQNEGVGGFTLPDRATNTDSNSVELQVRETAPISERMVHETRFQFGRDHSQTLPKTSAIAVNVLDAFQSGGATRFNQSTNRDYQFGDLLTYSKAKLTLRTGFQGTVHQYDTLSRDNFKGTFVFSNLDAFAAGTPVTFTANSGNPVLNMNQFEWGIFLQSDYRVSRMLMLSTGVRYEAQTNSSDHNNIDPRFGFALGVGGASVIRGGVGLFHQRLSAGNVQSVMRLDGTRQIQTVIENPTYPDPFAVIQSLSTTLPASLRQMAADLATPYTTNTSISYETRLPKNLFVSASYDFVRGMHLYRSRNINAPLAGQTTRPDPTRGNVLVLESSAASRYQELSFRLNQRIGSSTLFFNYSLSSNYNNTDGAFSIPADSYNLKPEWGRAAEYQRHSVFAGYNFQLPWAINANTRMRATSGRPYNITTGKDDNGDTLTNDRPAGGTRNTGNGPSQFTVDLTLRKTFNLKRSAQGSRAAIPAGVAPMPFMQGPGGGQGGGGEDGRPPEGGQGGYPGGGGGNNQRGRRGPTLAIYADLNNVLNHPNFNRYSGVLTSPYFGKPNSAQRPREIQMGVQFNF